MTGFTHPAKRLEANRDMISNLHASVLTNILSRLPAEDAVRTSILSKGWREKWFWIEKVLINDIQPVEVGLHDRDAYVKFVENALSLPENPRSFDLFLHRPYGPACITRWMTHILDRPDVECLKLRYFQDYDTVFPSVRNFFKLRDLELEWHCKLKLPATSFFPNLRRLYFMRVFIVNEHPDTDSMLLKFPVLESLTLKLCRWKKVKHVEIQAPSLTAFDCGTANYSDRADEYSIRIIGARLTKFYSSKGLLENVVISNNLSTVVSAGFMNGNGLIHDDILSSESSSRARQLMKEMVNVEDLKISVFMVEGMLKCGPFDCQYNKLQRLRLNSYTTFQWNTEAVRELLSATPYLKFLTIKGIIWERYYGGEIVMQPVPSCIIHHLEEVHFIYSGYIAVEHPLHVEKFLLTKGLQLRKCYISCYGYTPKHKIVKRLSAFIPESSSCHVSVAKK
jgi:hypothetical protein